MERSDFFKLKIGDLVLFNNKVKIIRSLEVTESLEKAIGFFDETFNRWFNLICCDLQPFQINIPTGTILRLLTNEEVTVIKKIEGTNYLVNLKGEKVIINLSETKLKDLECF